MRLESVSTVGADEDAFDVWADAAVAIKGLPVFVEHDVTVDLGEPLGLGRVAECETPSPRLVLVLVPSSGHALFCRDLQGFDRKGLRVIPLRVVDRASALDVKGNLETEWAEDSILRITTENTTLKQQVRQLTYDNQTLDDRLKAARSNVRFQDRRIAELEVQLLDWPDPRFTTTMPGRNTDQSNQENDCAGRDCGGVSQRARQGGSHSTCIARVSQTSRTPVNLFESASSYTEEK